MSESIDIHTGQPLNREQRIVQNIQVILTTPLQSMVMRREVGSRLNELIDNPVNAAWLTDVYAEAAAAIARWEPDFIVDSFQPVSLTPGNVIINIIGKDAQTGQPLTLSEITLNK
ncbi:GPW/gp25 family protein [Sansalvadorimonas verongulae]|uniref:GPW/gp25 family protein n=1 Tax=Sansalvadorimonas verongulae TaxID=2172824 RepID=UPI0012BBF7B4|nr:GPW/gp25 family protein [Sansalvadorimonas verongulae]MTI12631.1 hypothetical protein [Sansalvadorimonas verongulae]